MALISNGTTIASGGSLSVSANPPNTAGAVGTYAFLSKTVWTNLDGGDTTSGDIYYSSSTGTYNGSALSGTWRIMGHTTGSNNQNQNTSLFIRIS